jgi:hypothetical protein
MLPSCGGTKAFTMGSGKIPAKSEAEWKRTLFILLIITMICGAALISFWLRP